MAGIIFWGCDARRVAYARYHLSQRWPLGFLIAGAIIFPIGIIHGIGLWFGAF